MNPFSAKLNDALWTARLVAEGGTGDLRYKLNKESAAGTLSLLFQDSYSGRAEIGLAGDDDFRIKVSADGAVWKDALRIDRSTGTVAFPAGAALPPAAAIAGGITNLVVNGNFAVNQRAYVSGVALAAGAFGHDRWKGGAAGCTYTFTPSPPNTTITITSGSLIQAVEDAQVEGGSYVLSWTGSAQGRVGHSGAAASGSYAASPIAITGAGAGQQINIEFSSGTLGKVQLEPGTSTTPFERRPISLTELLCKRYYEVGRFDHRGYGTAGTLIGAHIPHRVAKRTTPTIALSGIVYANASTATADGIGTFGFRLLWTVVAAGAGGLSGTWASSAEL